MFAESVEFLKYIMSGKNDKDKTIPEKNLRNHQGQPYHYVDEDLRPRQVSYS